MILTSLLLAYPGLFLICLSMERHFTRLFDSRPTALQGRGLAIGGWLLLALSLPPSVFALGWVIGIAAWLGLLTLAAGTITLLLPYAPRSALVLGIASAVLAVIPLGMQAGQ